MFGWRLSRIIHLVLTSSLQNSPFITTQQCSLLWLHISRFYWWGFFSIIDCFEVPIIIPPIKLITGGIKNEAVWSLILRNVRTPDERDGDLSAQLSAHKVGENRLHEIIGRYTAPTALSHADALIEYADKLTRTAISHIPNGTYSFTDYLEPDIPISVEITADDEHLTFNFAGTSAAIKGNLNTVPAVAISAVAYCIRCLALDLTATDIPMNEGAFTPLSFDIPEGCLLNPRPPHAVAAGNVETSQRIVDVIFGALAQALPDKIPAASQGTMNNIIFGNQNTFL